jgi:L-seryl-tRNA(Ser) seleniumtransferase
VVTFSGDKLLGGPQAGILIGRQAVIDRLRQHPLARAVRSDKLCLAGLAATLAHYLKGEALKQVPVWRMISMTAEEVGQRAQVWVDMLRAAGLICEVVDGESVVGGGSLPGESLRSRVLHLRVGSVDVAAARLRAREVPVIVRVEDDDLVIDPRTVLPRDEDELIASLRELG